MISELWIFQTYEHPRFPRGHSIGPAMLNSGDTVIPSNIPYQDLVFSTEPAILTASKQA